MTPQEGPTLTDLPDAAENRSTRRPVGATGQRSASHGTAGNPYTCGGCDTTWSGVSRCHCSGCHRTFSGLASFDRHRTGGCTDPAGIVIRSKDGTERQAMRYDPEIGIWRSADEWDTTGIEFGGRQ